MEEEGRVEGGGGEGGKLEGRGEVMHHVTRSTNAGRKHFAQFEEKRRGRGLPAKKE